MSYENLSRVLQEMEPKLTDILSDFNRVLQEHGILGVAVSNFKVDEINNSLGETNFRENIDPCWCIVPPGICALRVRCPGDCRSCLAPLAFQEMEPTKLADILSNFNRVLQEHDILGVAVDECMIDEITESSAQ